MKTTPDFVTPIVLGEMDAQDKLPFCPEMYYIRYSDKCQYAVGYASIAGPSEMTDYFLVAKEVASIEDDYDFIRQGGA